MHPFAFFDVDSLVLSPNGRTYNCHPSFNDVSEELFDIYNLISAIFAPVVFTVDLNGKTPDTNQNRRDFLVVPVSKTEEVWKETVADRYKFYLQRTDSGDKESNVVFKNNENVVELIEMIKAKDWYVFGTGLKNGVDPAICNLLGIVNTVKFIPELIVPGEDETEEQLGNYLKDWENMGAIPVPYDKAFHLVHTKRSKLR